MDFLNADSLPWLHGLQQQLRDSLRAGRLPHSSLLLSVPGLGAEQLANWLAALALCEAGGRLPPDEVPRRDASQGAVQGEAAARDASQTAIQGETSRRWNASGADLPGERPCGVCPSCSLLRANTHPDYHLVKLEDDAKQIKVDQVRELIDSLSLKSYRGGYKVGVIEGAEALNTNGANAFLKTLEEPSANTLLIMIARPTHRLPATIASRCLRMSLRPPPVAAALEWLKDNGPSGQQWQAALTLAGGAPLLALELSHAGIAALETEMQDHLRSLSAGAVDVTLLADQWARSNLPLRIAWLENWITCRIHKALGAVSSRQSAERVRLPAALLKPKIRALFELLDATRDLRRLASTGMNQQLALEALLLGGRTALTS